jgi:predicted dehydrogenase
MSIELGLVGCGDITHVHADAVKPIQRKIRFTACCDIDRERALRWAKRYGAAESYGSLEEMLESARLDAVLIATWPNLHRGQIETCLDAGIKFILCEKALSITGGEAAEIWDLVRNAGACLVEGFMYRHHPAIRRLERMIAFGEIGAVDYVRAVFNAYDSEEAAVDSPELNWRQRPECAGGVPYDFACYAVNACGHFAGGAPVRVCAAGSMSDKYGVMDRLFGIVEYSNGRVGIVESTKKSDCNQEIAISGANGILRLPISWTISDDIVVEREFSVEWADLRRDRYTVPMANPYTLQLENFADVIGGAAAPVVPLSQSVVNAFVTEGLVDAARERLSVELAIPEPILNAYKEDI